MPGEKSIFLMGPSDVSFLHGGNISYWIMNRNFSFMDNIYYRNLIYESNFKLFNMCKSLYDSLFAVIP